MNCELKCDIINKREEGYKKYYSYKKRFRFCELKSEEEIIMKRVIKALLSLSIIMLIPLFAFAETIPQAESIYFANEAELINDLQNLEDSELEELGYSQEEIVELRNYSIESFLLERSRLPREVLASYGYTPEVIQLLKEYNGEPVDENSPVILAIPSCTGRFSGASTSSSAMTIMFTWEWSSYPAYLHTDEVAVCMQGFNASGTRKDTIASNYSASIGYAALGSSGTSTVAYVTPTYKKTNELLTASIPMKKNGGDLYAKRGVITFTVKPDGNYQFDHINVGSYYVHASTQIDITISVDTAGNFSVSPSVQRVSTVEIDGSARCSATGVIVNY